MRVSTYVFVKVFFFLQNYPENNTLLEIYISVLCNVFPFTVLVKSGNSVMSHIVSLFHIQQS